MKNKWNDSHLKLSYELALNTAMRDHWNFKEEDFSSIYLDGIKIKGYSKMKQITLAYHRGILRT